MKTSTIFSSALLTASAAAAPSLNLAERVARRAAGGLVHKPSPLIPATPPANAKFASNKTQTDYSGNWAGAVHKSPPSGSFNRIAGYFTVPNPTKPGGAGGGSYSSSAWYGIDGDTYGNAILQAGCDFTANDGGSSFDCWREYYPNALVDFDGFTVQPGDNVYVNLVVISPTEGTATLTNTRTGQTITDTLYAPSSSATIAGQNAEAIVEDYSVNGGLVPFANFGTVTFTNFQAFTTTGQTIGAGGATLIDIVNGGGQVITDAEIPNDGTVTVRYTGP